MRKSCRYQKLLRNEYLGFICKIGINITENEPSKVRFTDLTHYNCNAWIPFFASQPAPSQLASPQPHKKECNFITGFCSAVSKRNVLYGTRRQQPEKHGTGTGSASRWDRRSQGRDLGGQKSPGSGQHCADQSSEKRRFADRRCNINPSWHRLWSVYNRNTLIFIFAA